MTEEVPSPTRPNLNMGCYKEAQCLTGVASVGQPAERPRSAPAPPRIPTGELCVTPLGNYLVDSVVLEKEPVMESFRNIATNSLDA